MGVGHSLPLSVGDSIVKPGVPSIISEPIEHDPDAFMDEVMAFLRYPVTPLMDAVLKDWKVEEVGPDEFEVWVTLDGTKLSSYGYGNPEDPSLDSVAIHNKVKLVRAENYICSENHKPRWAGEEVELQVKTRADYTRDPFRIDFYWMTPEGERIADEQVRRGLQPIVDTAMNALAGREVKMRVDEVKKVILCDPIPDDVATYDSFFDSVIYVMKDANPLNLVVEDLTETKFRLSAGEGDPRQKVPNVQMFRFDKDKGTIVQDLMNLDETGKLATTYFTFHKSPLSLEVYATTEDGGRIAGEGTKRTIQAVVDGALFKAKASSWGLGLF